jgi:hypothetical protein
VGEHLRNVFLDRWSGQVNWIAVGVALFLAVGLSLRAWRLLRPNDRAGKIAGKAMAVFVFVGGGCLLLYLNNVGEKIWFGDIKPIDLIGFVPVIAGAYFFWDFFFNPKAHD